MPLDAEPEHALSALEEHHHFLLNSGASDDEETARPDLAHWANLITKYAKGPFNEREAFHALEDGAMLVHHIVSSKERQWLEDNGSAGAQEEQASRSQSALDDLAAKIRSQHGDLFECCDRSESRYPHAQMQHLRAVAGCLTKEMRFTAPPFEWVYEGFAPLLLPNVLESRRGMPLSLAMLVLVLLPRLGYYASWSVHRPGIALPKGMLQGTLANTPDPPYILIHSDDIAQQYVLDTRRQAGDWIQPKRTRSPAQLSSSCSADAVVAIWDAFAQTMIAASQRRGESDLVASWLYQQCSLSPADAILWQSPM